jgi:hypothetical protein
MSSPLQTALADYFNGLCCPIIPQGLITLTGGVADGLFTDLASAVAYIQGFTSASITDASLTGDVFKFTVPANTAFNLNTNFMDASGANFVDPDGLITSFSNDAFKKTTGNILVRSCTFADKAFNSAQGTVGVTNILLSATNDSFATAFTGTMNILGNIGTTEGNDYSNFFLSAGGATINALVSKSTSNGGLAEGDLLLAGSNGATVNYSL